MLKQGISQVHAKWAHLLRFNCHGKIPLSSALTKLIEVGLNFSEVLSIFLVKLSTLTNCVFEKFLLDKKLPWKIFQRSIGSAKAIFAGADAAEERSRRPHRIS